VTTRAWRKIRDVLGGNLHGKIDVPRSRTMRRWRHRGRLQNDPFEFGGLERMGVGTRLIIAPFAQFSIDKWSGFDCLGL